ncbi:hypothetical protein QO034_22680, partial [Sedimentitalea sp. JM2-8]
LRYRLASSWSCRSVVSVCSFIPATTLDSRDESHTEFVQQSRWYLSHSAKKPVPIVSRRFVLATALAVPVAAVDPFSGGANKGFGTPSADALTLSALLLALISALELVEKSIQIYKDMKANIELQNPDTESAQEGKVLSAIFNEDEYAESAVEHGSALPARILKNSPIQPDGQLYSWEANVPRGDSYKSRVEIPTVSPGDKLFETMTAKSAAADYFRVMMA